MRFSKILTVFILFIVTQSCFGWGTGHYDSAKLVLNNLPPEIKAFFPAAQQQLIIKKWCKYPDGHKASEEVNKLMGPDELAILKKHGIVRYQFHNPKGEVAAFLALSRAFREKNVERAALFAAILMHVLADESAFNHGPLIHYLTYTPYLYKGYAHNGLRFSDPAGFRNSTTFKARIKKQLENFHPRPFAKDVDGACTKLMALDMKRNAVMTSLEPGIAVGLNRKKSSGSENSAEKAMVELYVFQTKDIIDAIYTAWVLAQSNQKLVMPHDIGGKFWQLQQKWISSSRLQNVGIYKGLLDHDKSKPAIGIVFECPVRMDRCSLGFSSKYISAAIARSLRKEGKNVMPVKYADISKGLPVKGKMPVLILCAGKGKIDRKKISALKEYCKSGGRILWIGGRDSSVIPELSTVLKETDNSKIPVSSKYGVANKELIQKATIHFSGIAARTLGQKPYKFRANPNTRAGWHKPWCPFFIDTTVSGVIPLATLEIDGKQSCIAAAINNKAGKCIAVWLPEYLLSPYLYCDVPPNVDWSRPALDRVGTTLVNASINLLEQR